MDLNTLDTSGSVLFHLESKKSQVVADLLCRWWCAFWVSNRIIKDFVAVIFHHLEGMRFQTGHLQMRNLSGPACDQWLLTHQVA